MRALRAALADTQSMLDGLPPDLAWTPRP
jgi:hypothetical protein